MSAPETSASSTNEQTAIVPAKGCLEEIPSDLTAQKEESRAYIEGLLSKRTELVYGIGRLVAQTVIKLEKRLWDLWSGGNPITVLESVDWKEELDKPLLGKIVKLKRARKEILGQQEMAIVIGSMLENHFNHIYDRIVRNEVIEELQPLKNLADYSPYTLLFLWGHTTANVHFAINRLDLQLRSHAHYTKSLAGQLNTLINNRVVSIEQEVCTVVNNWNVSTLTGQKPFSFAVIVERESKD
jgi:hypothetical protein